MRVCLVSLNRFVHDSRARVLARSLVHAGHEVTVIAGGSDPPAVVDGARVRYIPTRYPTGPGRWRRRLRLMQPRALRTFLFHRALGRAAAGVGADILHPTSAAAVPIAVRAAVGEATVAREPGWPSAGEHDLISVAPGRAGASVSGAGPGSSFHTGPTATHETSPPAGRFAGRRLALCYRKTDTNPGRYLEAALRRAGVTVDVYTAEVPWTRIDASVDAVVFVESPYPALQIKGRNPGFPVVFWVHHGEHRLLTNIRLCDRYGAHAVLLGHSWHLAHRFPVPVHRFPFAVAPELYGDTPSPMDERPFDVAFVGAGLTGDDAAYAGRRALLSSLEKSLGSGRVAFLEGVAAARMAAIYDQARIVVDEGGTRHYPITMRVFEALGAGAVLLTAEAPGVELLLERGTHYLPLGGRPDEQVEALLGDERLAAIARAGYEHARRYHTYDHRVDDLMEVLDSLRGASPRDTTPSPPGLAGLVADDVDVQSVVAFGAPDLAAALPMHDVRDGEAITPLRPGSFDAVVIGPGGAGDLPGAVGAARRYIYAEANLSDVVRIVAKTRPGAEVGRENGLLRVVTE